MAAAAALARPLSAALCRRLGGQTGIAALVDDIVDRHAANPVLAARCRRGDLPQLKRDGTAFVGVATGCLLPATAPGEARAYAGLWRDGPAQRAALDDVALVLQEQGLGVDEASGVLACLRLALAQAAS